jgi:hypothetical protein
MPWKDPIPREGRGSEGEPRKKSSKNKMKRRGNCYVTSEAAYHLLGGKEAGWKPMRMRIKNDTHWFLKHENGLILDLTAEQFCSKLNYSKARGSGFLTKKPSKRALKLMQIMLWQKDK